MKLLIKFGGSILYDERNIINSDLLKKFVKEVSELKALGHKIIVVIGGGKATRNLVSNLQDLNIPQLDHISIMMTRVHATILRMLFGDLGDPHEYKSYQEILEFTWGDKIAVIGGLFPGQSTNGSAASISELLQVDRYYNLFTYDHVGKPLGDGNYGERISKISYRDFYELIREFRQIPGEYTLFDHNALNFVARSQIPVIFLNGTKHGQIHKHLNGEDIGTVVFNQNL